MFKDLSMRIFLLHLVAYVLAAAICAGINLYVSPGTIWWPWVLIGWGVALATHAFALLLRKTRRRERIFVDRKARAFAVHLFAYVAVVLVLLLVNVVTPPKVWWFYWVALGWGAGVAFQGWCTFFRNRKPVPTAQAKPAALKQTEPKTSPPASKAKPARTRAPSKRAPRAKKAES